MHHLSEELRDIIEAMQYTQPGYIFTRTNRQNQMPTYKQGNEKDSLACILLGEAIITEDQLPLSVCDLINELDINDDDFYDIADMDAIEQTMTLQTIREVYLFVITTLDKDARLIPITSHQNNAYADEHIGAYDNLRDVSLHMRKNGTIIAHTIQPDSALYRVRQYLRDIDRHNAPSEDKINKKLIAILQDCGLAKKEPLVIAYKQEQRHRLAWEEACDTYAIIGEVPEDHSLLDTFYTRGEMPITWAQFRLKHPALGIRHAFDFNAVKNQQMPSDIDETTALMNKLFIQANMKPFLCVPTTIVRNIRKNTVALMPKSKLENNLPHNIHYPVVPFSPEDSLHITLQYLNMAWRCDTP